MAKARFHFPDDFLWGTATSSHQVEGNNTNNDWWAWEQEGNILDGSESGLACDWWNRAEKDLDRAASLNNNTHRMSIEWSRVEPTRGQYDQQALARYREIIDAVCDRGMEPMVTLHHFTNPMWLAKLGGWEYEDVPNLFAEYTRKVVETIGDKVRLWVTINEPMVLAALSRIEGCFPPGRGSFNQARMMVQNLLQGHAAAYHTIHELYPHAAVGLTRNFIVFQPDGRSPLHRWAANTLHKVFNVQFDRALMSGKLEFPLGRGKIPELEGTLDFYGLNYYTRNMVRFDLTRPQTLFCHRLLNEGGTISDNKFGEIYPDGIYAAVRYASQYKLPIYITENGLPDIHDKHRSAFIIRHLMRIWKIIQNNVPIMGYYHWSLVDNFEWERGWLERFGLYALNPETQERTLRRSGELYRQICQANYIDHEIINEYTPELLTEVFPV